jgi:hypothetical protein
MEDEKYPAWLGDKLLNNSLDWASATKVSMQELMDNITLHDAYWYNTYVAGENNWILIINLDAIWNKSFCHDSEEWPFLIIKFQKVFCSFQEFGEHDLACRTIGGVEVTSIGGKDFDDWLDFTKIAGFLPLDVLQSIQAEGSLTRTEISTIYGGSLSLVHAPATEVLLYSEQGSRLAINLSAQP